MWKRNALPHYCKTNKNIDIDVRNAQMIGHGASHLSVCVGGRDEMTLILCRPGLRRIKMAERCVEYLTCCWMRAGTCGVPFKHARCAYNNVPVILYVNDCVSAWLNVRPLHWASSLCLLVRARPLCVYFSLTHKNQRRAAIVNCWLGKHIEKSPCGFLARGCWNALTRSS